jgi:hypothetical protein
MDSLRDIDPALPVERGGLSIDNKAGFTQRNCIPYAILEEGCAVCLFLARESTVHIGCTIDSSMSLWRGWFGSLEIAVAFIEHC